MAHSSSSPFPRLLLSSIFVLSTGILSACFGQSKLEACKIVEIEEPEFEIEITDVDIEGGEVEMVCGDDIVDVPWRQFRRKLDFDPKDYLERENDFEQKVMCSRDENSQKKEVLCVLAGQPSDAYQRLSFDYDD